MTSTTDSTPRASLTARIILAVVATLALLLLGAGAGLLIMTPSEGPSSEPSAVDIGFAQDMTMHHEQAVTMATLARERAADVQVRQLAFDIETNQRGQIGRMQGWLSLWGQPAQSAGAPMGWMHGDSGHTHGGSHGAHGGGHAMSNDSDSTMPGMATSAELSHLRSQHGPKFDVEFLQLMLRHHEGGAGMAKYGSQHAALPPVRGLAKNMLNSQATESDLMRQMLAEHGAHPLGG